MPWSRRRVLLPIVSTAFFYAVTGITPAMAMRLPGMGSQYLFAMLDSKKAHFDQKTSAAVLEASIQADGSKESASEDEEI